MSTFLDIKTSVRDNLNDAGVGTFFSAADINDSLQDAYDEVAAYSGGIIKKASSLSFEADRTYYDFKSLVSDFIGVLAIFNKSSNLWLLDDTSLKDFDKIRENWEVWKGTPRWWAPVNFKYTAICPKYASAGQSFDLYYSAAAPTIVDTDTPLIITDMQDLLEFYATADLLEQQEEFTKAASYWYGEEGFYEQLESYKERVKSLAKSDILFKI